MKVNKMIQAKVVLDSIPTNGSPDDRAITMVIHLPTMLDGEFEKHGNIASNSSSSRAIGFPITKLQPEPYYPLRVYTPSKQMHSVEPIDESVYVEFQEALKAIYEHTLSVLTPFKDKVHKQHLNRYLTPFAMQTKVITANIDAYENFFKLRLPEQADPNIQQLAEVMQVALSESTPVKRDNHIPFVSEAEKNKYTEIFLAKISAGRLARVSYDNLDKLEDTELAVTRANRLIEFEHVSCMEHQLLDLSDKVNQTGVSHTDSKENKYSGRIRGWVQYRKLLWN